MLKTLGKLSLIILLTGSIVFGPINVAASFEVVTVFTNQKTYFMRDTVEIWGDINRTTQENLIKIKIIDPDETIVYESQVELNRDGSDYKERFTLLDQSLVNGIYTIKASYDKKEGSTYFIFFKSIADQEVLDSSISFNKNVYSWTETVEISIFAPSYNRSNQIEYIGSGSELEGKINIETDLGMLENYRLIETEQGSGIFHGNVTLTGYTTLDLNGNSIKDDASGILSGDYPFDGKIPARNNGYIKVTFSNLEQEFEKTSSVKWNVAQMGYVKSGEGKNYHIRVIDKDMDLNRDVKERIVLGGTLYFNRGIILQETDYSSGIFEGYAYPIDAVYYDRTFPDSKSSTDFLRITPGPPFIEEPEETLEDKPAEHLKFDDIFEPPTETIQPTDTSAIPQVPIWVKRTATWWSQGLIDDAEFVNCIQYLVNQKIIITGAKKQTDHPFLPSIPKWVKDSAGFWGSGKFSTYSFDQSLKWLIENGYIHS